MKIIGVGLSKTGTTSLAAALQLLGFRCVHGPTPHLLEHADGLVDLPAAARYKELDRMYVGSKFVLTTREKDAWLDSCQRQWARSRIKHMSPKRRFEYRWCRVLLFGRTDFDRENHWQCYLRHLKDVRAYFADRPNDLLELNITAGDGWKMLCSFLRLPIPNARFPWKNRSLSA